MVKIIEYTKQLESEVKRLIEAIPDRFLAKMYDESLIYIFDKNRVIEKRLPIFKKRCLPSIGQIMFDPRKLNLEDERTEIRLGYYSDEDYHLIKYIGEEIAKRFPRIGQIKIEKWNDPLETIYNLDENVMMMRRVI
jgi:hypothetical protein